MVDWRHIEDFPGYSINDLGQVLNEWRDQILTPRLNKQGFLMLGLVRDGQQHMRSVAKLVATAFVEKMNKTFNTVIHLNGDRSDCRAVNLMWRTRPFAIRYHAMFEEDPFRVSVYIPATDQFFYSLREACTTYGLIERVAFVNMYNNEPCYPYSWTIEEAKE